MIALLFIFQRKIQFINTPLYDFLKFLIFKIKVLYIQVRFKLELAINEIFRELKTEKEMT